MNVLLDREYTPEDLLRLPDSHRYELVDGRLVEKAMGAKSSRIAVRIAALMDAHAVAQKLGKVFGSDCGYQIFPDRPNKVRLPDVSFIAGGRLPNDEVPEGHVSIPPDLAVEVVSPNDLAHEVDQKVEEYLKAGVRLVWVVYPGTGVLLAFRADGSVSRLRLADELSGEDVVKEFRCRVADLFDAGAGGGSGSSPAAGGPP